MILQCTCFLYCIISKSLLKSKYIFLSVFLLLTASGYCVFKKLSYYCITYVWCIESLKTVSYHFKLSGVFLVLLAGQEALEGKHVIWSSSSQSGFGPCLFLKIQNLNKVVLHCNSYRRSILYLYLTFLHSANITLFHK